MTRLYAKTYILQVLSSDVIDKRGTFFFRVEMALPLPSNLLPVCILFLVCHIWRAAADICSGGTLCPDDCCYEYDYEYCCYDVATEWWFWFVWSFILLVILLTCCAVIKKRQLQRQRQVIVVQQGYATTTGYGTLVSSEVPQRPYVPPMYNPYAGYPQPPPGPAPPYQQAAAAAPPAAAAGGPQQQQAYPDQTAASKQGEHNPSNYPPPPYNPGN